MEFVKYQHIERYGTTEVENIELGKCYVFPKLDGTNASVWLDNGEIQCGSRKRHLNKDEKDNAGFMEWAKQQINLIEYLKAYPTHRIFGEWLVPHSLKTYRQDAWKKFYVFDVAIDKTESEITHEFDSTIKYLDFDSYVDGLVSFGIDVIRPIAIVENGDYQKFVSLMDKNDYLIENGKGKGEGIVLKNYDFKNKYGRNSWAKIVTSEFKEEHIKEMGATVIKGKDFVEEKIVDKYVTTALCEKVFSKINNESGFTSKSIPQLLNTVYYDLVKEDAWNFVKENKNPKIDFGKLQHVTFAKVKKNLPHLF